MFLRLAEASLGEASGFERVGVVVLANAVLIQLDMPLANSG